MKIRLIPGEMRFRLSPSDIKSLSNQQECSMVVYDGLSFTLCIGPSFYSHFEDGHHLIMLAQQDIETWLASSQVGVQFFDTHGILYVFEKNLKCTDPKKSCQSEDAFDWPSPT